MLPFLRQIGKAGYLKLDIEFIGIEQYLWMEDEVSFQEISLGFIERMQVT